MNNSIRNICIAPSNRKLLFVYWMPALISAELRLGSFKQWCFFQCDTLRCNQGTFYSGIVRAGKTERSESPCYRTVDRDFQVWCSASYRKPLPCPVIRLPTPIWSGRVAIFTVPSMHATPGEIEWNWRGRRWIRSTCLVSIPRTRSLWP